MSGNLMLHAGAESATLEEVYESHTPEPTDTHFPIPHRALIETVRGHVEAVGLSVQREEYGLWHDGARMFGMWALNNGSEHPDYQLALGLRNAHDKSFSAGVGVGNRVFVCDNMSFIAEIMVMRKHTRYIIQDLDRMVAEAAGRIGEAKIAQDERIASYKNTALDDADVHDVLIRAVDAKVMANSYIPRVLGEWREPTHDEFAPRNAWSLFNGFTEVLKGANPLELPRRTMRLHGIMDEVSAVHRDPSQLRMDFGVGDATPDFN